jgi:hypothetical protein
MEQTEAAAATVINSNVVVNPNSTLINHTKEVGKSKSKLQASALNYFNEFLNYQFKSTLEESSIFTIQTIGNHRLNADTISLFADYLHKKCCDRLKKHASRDNYISAIKNIILSDYRPDLCNDPKFTSDYSKIRKVTEKKSIQRAAETHTELADHSVLFTLKDLDYICLRLFMKGKAFASTRCLFSQDFQAAGRISELTSDCMNWKCISSKYDPNCFKIKWFRIKTGTYSEYTIFPYGNDSWFSCPYHCLGSQIVLLDSPSQNLFPDLNHKSKINFFVKTILNRLINN